MAKKSKKAAGKPAASKKSPDALSAADRDARADRQAEHIRTAVARRHARHRGPHAQPHADDE